MYGLFTYNEIRWKKWPHERTSREMAIWVNAIPIPWSRWGKCLRPEIWCRAVAWREAVRYAVKMMVQLFVEVLKWILIYLYHNSKVHNISIVGLDFCLICLLFIIFFISESCIKSIFSQSIHGASGVELAPLHLKSLLGREGTFEPWNRKTRLVYG